MAKLPKLKFPFLHHFSRGQTYKVDIMKPDYLEAAHNIFLYYASKRGSGIGKDVVGDIEHTKMTLFSKSRTCSITDVESDNLVAMISTLPSPLTRNWSPLLHAGYINVDAAYRNKGLGGDLLEIFRDIGMHWGYHGGCSRVSINNDNYNLHVRRNWKGVKVQFTGGIPRSVLVAGQGEVDDMVLFYDYGKLCEEVEIATQNGPIPLPCAMPEILHDPLSWNVDFEPREFKTNKGPIQVIAAEPQDQPEINQLIQDFAAKGDGFAIDELAPDGSINKKTFYESLTLVAKDQKDAVAAIAIVGPSAICRSIHPPLMQCYAAVSENYQNEQVGKNLVDACFKFAKKQEFKGVLSDIYLSNRKGLQFAVSVGMLCTGTVPYSGYIKGKGYTDCVLMYKNIS